MVPNQGEWVWVWVLFVWVFYETWSKLGEGRATMATRRERDSFWVACLSLEEKNRWIMILFKLLYLYFFQYLFIPDFYFILSMIMYPSLPSSLRVSCWSTGRRSLDTKLIFPLCLRLQEKSVKANKFFIFHFFLLLLRFRQKKSVFVWRSVSKPLEETDLMLQTS